MTDDPLDELPEDSRTEITAAIRAVIDVDRAVAEDIARSAEPLWAAMERAGGLVDSWGGGEFSVLLPRVLAFIKAAGRGS